MQVEGITTCFSVFYIGLETMKMVMVHEKCMNREYLK